MVYITRVEKFNAAHKLWVEEWSEEKNFLIFGKCANPNWHGHNYELHITIKGEPDPITGFIVDAKKLSASVREIVIEKLDHKNLNLDVDFIRSSKLPTVENLVVCIWNELDAHLKGCTLHSLKLYETDTIYAEFFGE